MKTKKKIIRTSTIPLSLNIFCRDLLKELNEKYEVVALSTPGPELIELAEREGVRTIAVPMERHISPMKDFMSLWRMVRVFRQERPQIVHSMTPKAGLLCMIAAWWTKVPVRTHTFTGLVFPTASGIKRKILILTDKITCACATHIIPEGEGVMRDLQNNGITKKPMKVLGYGNVRGVDMEYYSKREDVIRRMEDLKLRDETKFTFVFVGRMVRDKGIDELIEAFKKVYFDFPNSRLYLVGPTEDNLDPIDDKTRNAIESYDDIIEVGPKMGEDLLPYYAASDCFVLPSYREGFPNTVLEAGAMGLPSIVTNINGSREIIQDGINGMIVPPHDANALYKAMAKMIKDVELRNQMAGNARGMIASRFEQGFVRQCLYDFYDSVLPN